MPDRRSAAAPGLPRGFRALIGAQFFSALADHALLIVAIEHLAQTGRPTWWAPLLKLSFTIAYVVLAPVFGALADAVPKARLMAAMNAVKALGVIALATGVHPLLALAIVGLGAAAYAPAKYGLVTELVEPRTLVRANAWLEVSVVGAVLLGTALGGGLVSTLFATSPAAALGAALAAHGFAAGTTLGAAYGLLLAVYAVAALVNRAIPDSGARYARRPAHPRALLRDFATAQATFWRDAEGDRLSLAVTALFWGFGAVLQFAVLKHAQDALGLPLSQGAALQAVVALGVVAGAAFAGRHVGLQAVPRVLPAGVVLGLLVAAGALVTQLALALPLLAAIGAVGGLLVVPMNALLQHRGHQLLTAGRSVAVQGFNENASVLVGLALYAALLRQDVAIAPLMTGLGALLAVLMAWPTWRHRRAWSPGTGGAVSRPAAAAAAGAAPPAAPAPPPSARTRAHPPRDPSRAASRYDGHPGR